ncbi:MAG TPA: SDR family oxidoreductase [Longimicrobiales bacterium]|nr:SDR family oxidoreductase [Longimicrobiales bacterium]
MTVSSLVPDVRRALDMSGRRVLVTGGTGGLGRAMCTRFAACGARVLVHYLRDADGARALAASLPPDSAAVLQANLAAEDEVDTMVAAALAEWDGLDVIVHCASLGTFGPLLETRTSHWELTHAVHTRALWLIARRAAADMPPGSAIVALSSLGGQRAMAAYGAVGVAKAALEGLVRYLAAELAPRGIRVNGIAGGPVEGERLRGSPIYRELRAAAAARAGGRFATPEEIADVALLLASPLARWVQGQTLAVDGGFSLW